jgi:hypothetical protein
MVSGLDTEDGGVWGALEGSGIPEMLAGSFPPEPDRADWPELDGSTGGRMWQAALEDWMEDCLAQAAAAAGVASLLERLDALEAFRGGVAAALAGGRLPPEPRPADYAAARPAYEGEFDDIAYRWDHSGWRAEFEGAARRLEDRLTGLLGAADGPAPRLGGRPERWDRVDPAGLDALRDLAVLGGGGRAPGTGRDCLEGLIAPFGGRRVSVEGPQGRAWRGRAGQAWRGLPPGVHDAVGEDGRRLRLVVAAAGRDGKGWAAAVDPASREDRQILGRVARFRAEAIRDRRATAPTPAAGGPRPAAPLAGLPGGGDGWFGQARPGAGGAGIGI